MSSMDPPPKHRPKSAPVITNAYVQNKREDEYLCEKLDTIHYQHYAGLIKLKQAAGHIIRQRKVLQTQRAMTPQSRLDHVLDEIHTFKKDRQGSGLSKSRLPASTELYADNSASSRWPATPFYQSPTKHGEVKMVPVATSVAMYPLTENTKMKAVEGSAKHPQGLERSTRRPRATSALERRSNSSMDLMTFKQLGDICRIEKISVREAERQKQQVRLEKQNMNKIIDNDLQEKVHNFLKKLD